MGPTEITIYLILTTAVVIVLIGGIIFYLFLYRHKTIVHKVEKENLTHQHQLEILNTEMESQRHTAEHIGREIHDSVAQKITLASIYIQKLQFGPGKEIASEEFSTINDILSKALQELRNLSKDLSGDALSKLPLELLILEECKVVNNSGKCTVKFYSNDFPPCDINTKITFLRIVQEFLQNSLKHSRCKSINIEPKAEDSAFILLMEDDGIGFDLHADNIKGVGLEGIRRRVEFLHGTCDMESNTGEGFRCLVTVPQEK